MAGRGIPSLNPGLHKLPHFELSVVQSFDRIQSLLRALSSFLAKKDVGEASKTAGTRILPRHVHMGSLGPLVFAHLVTVGELESLEGATHGNTPSNQKHVLFVCGYALV